MQETKRTKTTARTLATYRAGYKIKPPSLPKPTQEQVVQVEIWPSSKKTNVTTRDPISSELIEREKLPTNKIVVFDDLRGAHRLVSYTNQVLRQAKPDAYNHLALPWNAKVDHPYLDLRVSKQSVSRSLKIMDALIKGMEVRGFQIAKKDGVGFEVNGEKVRFYYINERVKRTERELTAAEKEQYWGF